MLLAKPPGSGNEGVSVSLSYSDARSTQPSPHGLAAGGGLADAPSAPVCLTSHGDQDGLNCVDRVRRHLGVAVGTAAGRWWAGTLRHWPLHERRARRARCLRRREEAVTKRRPARRRQPGARSGGGEMVTASGSMSEDDDGGGALAGGKGAAGMPARSAAAAS